MHYDVDTPRTNKRSHVRFRFPNRVHEPWQCLREALTYHSNAGVVFTFRYPLLCDVVYYQSREIGSKPSTTPLGLCVSLACLIGMNQLIKVKPREIVCNDWHFPIHFITKFDLLAFVVISFVLSQSFHDASGIVQAQASCILKGEKEASVQGDTSRIREKLSQVGSTNNQ